MDKQKVKKYWQEVRRRAWGDAMNKSGAYLFFLSGLILAMTIIAISGVLYATGLIKYPFFRDNITANNITGFAQLVVAIILAAIFYNSALREVPPKMYEELGGFIDDPFEVAGRPPYEKYADSPRWASIDLTNTSPQIISKCYVEVVKVIDSNGKKVIPVIQNLKWSKSHSDSERSKEVEVIHSKICDVAVAIPKNNIILFETWAGQYFAGQGIYKISVIIRGYFKGVRINKPCDFILEYNGGNLINIRKKGQRKWNESELDPKPIQTIVLEERKNKRKNRSK